MFGTTMVDASTPEARVRRGAAWLDIKRPGWHEEINIARLDVGSGEDCIIAQLNGDNFARGMATMDSAWEIDSAAHGFMPGTKADERALNRAWTALILRRLHGEKPALHIRLWAALRRILPA